MRIGIDCRTILNPNGGERAGVGHYTYFLIKNLIKIDSKNTYVLFFDSRFKDVKEFEADNVEIKFFPFYQYKKYLPITYSQMLISAVLSREKLDIFHSPANTIPISYSGPAVVTIHDLAIYKYPDFFPTKFLNRQTFSTKFLVPRSLQKAKKIIAISKSTKTDIVEEFGIKEEKIKVVYEGVIGEKESCPTDQVFNVVAKKYGVNKKYLLFIGTIEPRKNLVALIRAYRNLRLAYNSPVVDCQLIIAGSDGWKNQLIYEAIADANSSILGIKQRRNGKERRSALDTRSAKRRKIEGERRSNNERRVGQPVKHIGYITHEEKITLICHAECFVFPSMYEGFGLPVLEAMNLGTPVITSNVSSLPEIVGDKNSILVNPNKESDIADAITQVLTDDGLRESLCINGKNRSKYFSWEKCAQETLEVYQSVMEDK